MGTVAQSDLLCVNCAGQCAFDPASGALMCQSCATQHDIVVDPNADPSAELHYHPDMPHTEQAKVGRTRPHACQTCGGEVVFQGQFISTKCPYCDGALVERDAFESFDALGVIPFAVVARQAQDQARTWVGNRWGAPKDLPGAVAGARVAGIYVPFWTFDSREAVDYTVWYKVQRGKETSLSWKSDRMNTDFDDMLVPASPHVTPLIRDGILHEFDPTALRPFEEAYLAGFAADYHHQTVGDGLRLNAEDKDLLLRNRIKVHSGKSRVVRVTYKTHTSGIRYRRILLPVWILHYSYEGEPYKVVTCGIHGRTYGERPFSMKKLLGFAAVVASAVTAFGFVWGANGAF